MSDTALMGGYPYAAQSRNPFNYSKFEQIERDVTTAWLTLTEITNQLNLFGDTSQNTYLSSVELATRFAIEDFLGLSIFPTKYRVYYGGEGMVATPSSLDLPEVSLNANPALPGVTINSLGYWNDSTPAMFTALTGYYYDATGNKVILASLPSNINTNMTAPIVMEYTTVANPLASYPVIKQAGLLLLTHIYNNRSNTTDVQLKDIPFGVATLLRPYKPLVF